MSASPQVKRKNGSSVWDYFIICDDGRSKCQKCESKYSKSTSTSTLKSHLKSEHSIELIVNKDSETNILEKLPKVKHGRSSNDDITELLLDWIIDDKQAFRVVENEKFRRFINVLDPAYVLPVRKTISSKVDVLYENKLEFLKVLFISFWN